LIEPLALRAAKAFRVEWGGAPSQGTALDFGGERAPADSGYTKIYSNEHAFAALKADGSITTWGGAFLPPKFG
jgi:hypothetical protein